jgi:hypothetical protein
MGKGKGRAPNRTAAPANTIDAANLAAELRQRQAAAFRLPPLADGRHDPLVPSGHRAADLPVCPDCGVLADPEPIRGACWNPRCPGPPTDISGQVPAGDES